MMKYIYIGGILFLVSAGFYIDYLRSVNHHNQQQIETLEAQAQTNEANIKLVVQHLDREAELRIKAEEALSQLMKEVPDVEYQQTLPPNIQRVVDSFHRSIGRSGP